MTIGKYYNYLYIDSQGNTVAKYSYDAWGKCTITEDGSDNNIASINPYRYRSYYYDAEIDMYYLQSRYYDANVGRFVNADDPEYVDSNDSVLGQNLYAYCENQPCIRQDKLGDYWKRLIYLSYPFSHWIFFGLTRLHYRYNKSLKVSGYIYDQENSTVSNFRFGFFKSSYNGCGWIATYNALLMLGVKELPLPCNIIAEYEMNGVVLYSVFGIYPWAINMFFKSRKYSVKTYYNIDKFDEAAMNSDACILWAWKGVTAHFTAIKYEDGIFKAYNTYGDSNGICRTYRDWGYSISYKIEQLRLWGYRLITIKNRGNYE